MTIYSLENMLTKLPLDKSEINEISHYTELSLASKSGYLFLASECEAEWALAFADVAYEGEILLAGIEFCRIESQQECIVGTLDIPRVSDICGSQYKIRFFINEKNIVIVDNTSYSEKLIQRIVQNRIKQGHTRERVLYYYLAGIIIQDLSILGYLEHRIMEFEDEVTEGKFQNFIDHMSKIRRELLVYREYYDELVDMGKELEENENQFFQKKHIKYFGTFSDRADRLMNRTLYLLDYIGQVRDSYQQKVSEQQNQNMQFLTIISTIFFPLTLITGWYGMNFQNMPELTKGYPFVIVLSVIVVVIIILIFKKKKII